MTDTASGTARGRLSVGFVMPRLTGDRAIAFPRMVPVEQRFRSERIDDVPGAVRAALAPFSALDVRGKRIAVTGGSRGIAGMVEVLRTIVAQLREWGAEPFLFPAMGSHGGGTAEGQIAVLENLGMTEAAIGAPIRSSMDVVEVGKISGGQPVYCDRIASESDGIVLCNRVKPHPTFKASHESGLVKMLVIGMGKQEGASAIHQLGFDRFHEILPAAAQCVLDRAPVLFGVALVENAYDQLAVVEAVAPDRILAREPELLRHAKATMGRLLAPAIDVLIVDKIGKDISGAGMDPNVTGRTGWRLPGFDAPPIQRIVVRDLTEKTAGNATGLGMADFTTRRCAHKIDLEVTYTNGVTALNLDPAKIPLIAENDREALVMALKSCRGATPETARIVHIRNTKALERIWISPSAMADLEGRDDVVPQGPAADIRFDANGDLAPWA